MSRHAALRALMAGLRGEPPPACDWMAVLRLANEALVTPQLHAALAASGAIEAVPAEVRTFTAEVFERNRARNRRLLETLAEALGALNAAGIEPVLLKGAALWFAQGAPSPSDRLMNDLDLLVRPAEAERATAALSAADFRVHHAYAGPKVHVVAELARPTDVGFVDLHQRAPGPPGLAEAATAQALLRPVRWRGLRALAPEPAAQVFLLVLHDQFHDGDYWRGGFTLKHLLDIAALAGGPDPVDWERVSRLASTRLARHALEAELAAAAGLAGARVPAALRSRWGGLQHARHLAQFRWPGLIAPLAALAAVLEAPSLAAHRAADRRDREQLFGESRLSAGPGERLERLRYILDGLADGKI